jgi:uncharacterized protein
LAPPPVYDVRRMTNLLLLLLALILIAYGVVVAFMYGMQRSLLYYPANRGLTPDAVGLAGVQVNRIATEDGESIVTWYSPPKPDSPVIVYFHGNAGEIGDRAERFHYFAKRGFGVLFVSYRGFGGSTGSISEPGLVVDALTAYDWLVRQHVQPAQIAVIGESLGTGVALQLAEQRPVGAIALEAPYTSTADIGAAIYWWLPVRLLMADQFRSLDRIGDVRVPLLIIHGEEDALIPVSHGKALFAAANEPKRFVVVPQAGHEIVGNEATWQTEVEFFRAHLMPGKEIQ